MSEDIVVELKNVSKRFKDYQVLEEVNLQCPAQTITGIMGRNGSGKSVLFKCICGFLKQDKGEIFLQGEKNTDYIKSVCKLGAIIEEPAFLKQYSGIKNLELLYLIRNKANREHLKNIMGKVGLDYKSSKGVSKYSMGMKQRLAIAQAIMEDQDILILDEPMNGLDSESVRKIKMLLAELRESGKTIILASHNKDDLDQICNEIYVMEQGKLQPWA